MSIEYAVVITIHRQYLEVLDIVYDSILNDHYCNIDIHYRQLLIENKIPHCIGKTYYRYLPIETKNLIMWMNQMTFNDYEKDHFNHLKKEYEINRVLKLT